MSYSKSADDDQLFFWDGPYGVTTTESLRGIYGGDGEPWKSDEKMPKPHWLPSTIICLDFNENVSALRKEPRFYHFLEEISKLADWHFTDWTRDLNMPSKVLLAIGWKNEVKSAQARALSSPTIHFESLEPLLIQKPLMTTLCMMPPFKYRFEPFLYHPQEIIVIQGLQEKIDPEIMIAFQNLHSHTYPLICGDDAPTAYHRCHVGSTTISIRNESEASTLQKTVVASVAWKSWENRLKFLDPKQKSDGPDDLWESTIGISLRKMEENGVLVRHWFVDKSKPYPGDEEPQERSASALLTSWTKFKDSVSTSRRTETS